LERQAGCGSGARVTQLLLRTVNSAHRLSQ
jgi:hypothetical protein